jgi:hypothetical protein
MNRRTMISTEISADEELVKRCKSGDESAFNEVKRKEDVQKQDE